METKFFSVCEYDCVMPKEIKAEIKDCYGDSEPVEGVSRAYDEELILKIGAIISREFDLALKDAINEACAYVSCIEAQRVH